MGAQQLDKVARLSMQEGLVGGDCGLRAAHLTGREQAQVIPRARYMIELFESRQNSNSEIYHFHQPPIIQLRTISINSDTIPHARDDQPLHNGEHHVPREEVPQVAETQQETHALLNHISDVNVPAEVTVENHTKVFNVGALLQGLPTDPHADRW